MGDRVSAPEVAYNERAAALVGVLRGRGVDSTDLRHCVHEASHALDAKLIEPWTNRNVASAMKRLGPGRAAASELLARAVEQLVCARVGVTILPLEKWIFTSCMEAMKFRDPFLGYEEALSAARRSMDSEEARERADQILSLTEVATPRRRGGKKR